MKWKFETCYWKWIKTHVAAAECWMWPKRNWIFETFVNLIVLFERIQLFHKEYADVSQECSSSLVWTSSNLCTHQRTASPEKCSQHCFWTLYSSTMWHCVVGWEVSDVFKECFCWDRLTLNLSKTKRGPLYLKTQSLPLSKHFPPRL